MKRLEVSAEEFRQLSQQAAALAADYLDSLPSRRSFPEISGARTEKVFSETLPEEGAGEAALDALRDVLELSRPPSPRFFGYVLVRASRWRRSGTCWPAC